MLRITALALVLSGAFALEQSHFRARLEILQDPKEAADKAAKEAEKATKKVPKAEVPKDLPKAEVPKEVKDAKAPEVPKEVPKAEVPKEVPKAEVPKEVPKAEVPKEVKDAKAPEVPKEVKDAKVPKELPKADAPEVPKEVPEAKVPEEVPEVPKEVPEVKEPEVPEEVEKVVPETPEVFPVPTTSRCIVIMCVQYMVVYTALAICRTYTELTGSPKGKVEAGLRAATQTLTYGPMLCVLFIACRMRVEFLSDGKGQPQQWVQNCMYALTFAVLASTLLVLVVPFVTGKPVALKEGGDLERPELGEGDSKAAFYALTTIRYLILLGLYGGIAGVIYGICTYLPPGETELSHLPAPAPAVMCTMILTVVFFSTQLVIAVCRSYTEFTGTELPMVTGVMNAAASTVEFAPMLAILFLAARMRALQHDSQPQAWAQSAMYYSTFAMCFTTLLAIAVPIAMGGSMGEDATSFELPNPVIGYILLVIRCLCMMVFYGGVVAVAYSIFTFVAPGGPEATLPVSPTVQCVVNLTCQFFFVYLMLTVMQTVSEVTGAKLEESRVFSALDAAKATLCFAPMLAILFVTTRMYALLITNNKGAPQAWVQDGMYMATWSLLISFTMCLATGLVTDVETDEDGNIVTKFNNKYVHIAFTVVRYLSMILLYGGIITVIVGLFVMTPETANGRGSVPLVSDAVDATPVGQAPPGPDSVASTAGSAAGTAGSAAKSGGDAIKDATK